MGHIVPCSQVYDHKAEPRGPMGGRRKYEEILEPRGSRRPGGKQEKKTSPVQSVALVDAQSAGGDRAGRLDLLHHLLPGLCSPQDPSCSGGHCGLVPGVTCHLTD